MATVRNFMVGATLATNNVRAGNFFVLTGIKTTAHFCRVVVTVESFQLR